MNRKSLILTAAALLLIIAGALGGYTYLSRGESAPQLSENDGEAAVEGEGESAPQPAPDFTVYDAEGNEITLSAIYSSALSRVSRCPSVMFIMTKLTSPPRRS